MKTLFLQLLESEDKAADLSAAIARRPGGPSRGRFEVDPRSFSVIPRSPFAYWVSDRVRDLYAALPKLEAPGRQAVSGGKTLDDFRWIRTHWETALVRNSPWVGFAKGGTFSPFYADVYLQLDWHDNARSLKVYLVSYRSARGWSPNWTAELHGSSYYLRPGLTWPRRTDGLSVRAMPAGCVFGDKGPGAFVDRDQRNPLLSLAALMNSQAFGSLVSLQLARTELAQSYEVGVIQSTPMPRLSPADEGGLASLARRAWSLKRSVDTRTETSHAFVLPALLQVQGETMIARALTWSEWGRKIEAELAAIQAEIDDRCFALYGIDEEDRQAITDGFGGGSSGLQPAELGEVDAEDTDEEKEESEAGADTAALVAELVSWAVGVAFGRFDVRLATGQRALPTEPEPFDPLPISSPGMLTSDDELPLTRPPAGYPLSFPEDGVLVDDPGHPRELTAAVRAVFEVVFGSGADALWQEAAAILNPRDHDLRRWITAGFFEHHLGRHSKSRRKAPILWQLSIPSGRYSVWCCAHRMTRDSLFAIQNEVVASKLAHEERQLSSLVTEADHTPSAHARAQIADQDSLVAELRVMLDEVRRAAPLWNPDLDDGIVLVMAPLWRLVPTHKAWQRELRAKWDDLVAGRYDWAHLAMHLWPERVIPKCATDRSLAIAHDLEDVLWIEGSDGKWTPRSSPTLAMGELIAARTSPAVKAALASLRQAPALPTASETRHRKSG